ncbi:hypothetical protein C5167_047495 [Papaver somniferum]|uniref:Uncharacterized protein n=1 Tax=Papaver somniferum TaxID=3469 RepID=A0A4Y7LHI3_PAPSO|nr:hypothetical protein C5167_047495 [Papaver somniferum]
MDESLIASFSIHSIFFFFSATPFHKILNHSGTKDTSKDSIELLVSLGYEYDA